MIYSNSIQRKKQIKIKTSYKIALQNAIFLTQACLRKPLFAARLASEFTRVRVLRHKRLRFIDIAIGYACNMRCVHCSSSNFIRNDEPQLSIDEYRRIALMLCREGCLVFHFTGGEPLIREDLEEIISVFYPERSAISIQSNGLASTRERLLSLRKSGVDIFNVSIDSGIPEEHNSFRKTEDAFSKALQALDDAISLGYSVSVSTCICHSNLYSKGLYEIIRLTAERRIWCSFNLAVPTGNWRGNDKDILTPEDQVFWRQLLEEYPHCRIDMNNNWSRIGCGAVKEKIYLTAYGDIMPCPFIHVSLGNLRKESVSLIRERGLKIPEFSDYWPKCLAAEENTFMKKIFCCNRESEISPIHYTQVEWMRNHITDNDKNDIEGNT